MWVKIATNNFNNKYLLYITKHYEMTLLFIGFNVSFIEPEGIPVSYSQIHVL